MEFTRTAIRDRFRNKVAIVTGGTSNSTYVVDVKKGIILPKIVELKIVFTTKQLLPSITLSKEETDPNCENQTIADLCGFIACKVNDTVTARKHNNTTFVDLIDATGKCYASYFLPIYPER